MNVLIIGSGGREHCLAWKVSQSSLVKKIFSIPGNPGIKQIGSCFNLEVKKENFKLIKDFALQNNIDFTIVGPEAPLVDGIVDYFNNFGLKIFGPDSNAARIEGSKVFTKNLCKKYNIPTAESVIFFREEIDKIKNYINKLSEKRFPLVLKVDGLAAGKGVIICKNKQEALDGLNDCLEKNIFGSAADKIIIEDFIEGFEVSILNLCDGKDIIPMVLAQDYKKIFDNDIGKNTGGMGSFSPVPFVSDKLYEKILNLIIYPTFEALKKENIYYKGILYGGIIISNDEPYLLEYNCRFGDPETQVILPRLEDDLVELLLSCINGKLANQKLHWDNLKCVCVVIASKGYPESSSKGDLIEGLDKINSQSYNFKNKNFNEFSDLNNDIKINSFLAENKKNNVLIFHAGTKFENQKYYTNGGRVLNLVSKAPTFKDARKNIYSEILKINFEGMQYRKDIALKAELFEDSVSF